MADGRSLPLPSSLIVGAARCGTTSLYSYLQAHPQVYMSAIKEPSYIQSRFMRVPEQDPGDDRRPVVTALEDYARLFEPAYGRRAVGESSSDNLYYARQAIPHIRAVLGEPRIIMVLRAPVDRAYGVRRVTGLSATKSSMRPAIRQALAETFRDDIRRREGLLPLDWDCWAQTGRARR